MSAVFQIPADELYDESFLNSKEPWDSLKQMQLVVALEEEFDTKFTDEEMFKMLNYELIKHVITKRHL